MRFDVVAAKVPGPGNEVLSSHENVKEAAEAAKAAALASGGIAEVYDHELKRPVFRAKSGEWRWITR